MFMDSFKSSDQCIAKEPAQPKVTNHLMKNDFICIFRTRDLLANQEQIFPVKNTVSIFQRVKSKIGNLFHN